MAGADDLAAAITASGLPARRFATAVLGVDERTVRRWLAGEREIPEPVRRMCVVLQSRRWLARALEQAAETNP